MLKVCRKIAFAPSVRNGFREDNVRYRLYGYKLTKIFDIIKLNMSNNIFLWKNAFRMA